MVERHRKHPFTLQLIILSNHFKLLWKIGRAIPEFLLMGKIDSMKSLEILSHSVVFYL